MRRKPTNRTNYHEVTALYEATGRNDYQLKSVNDIKVIHGYDIRETTGYEDLTESQKATFEAYVIKHLNSVGMNTRLTMWPRSVHFVREVTLLSAEYYDEEDKRNYRHEIGREYIILKANGKTKKWKRFIYEDEDEKNIDATSDKEFLRVDWKYGSGSEWFHVSDKLEYY